MLVNWDLSRTIGEHGGASTKKTKPPTLLLYHETGYTTKQQE
jgi:hypothetical protein